MPENRIITDKNLLVVLQKEINAETGYLIAHFCGEVVYSLPATQDGRRMYVCGDLIHVQDGSLLVIKELSSNYAHLTRIVTLGEVPIIISKAGVYYRQFFADDQYFNKIKTEHAFQELTESNKPHKALRTGIYLSNITRDEKDGLHFRLLRCSSNFTGPTDNFRSTDHQIIQALNEAVKYVFAYETELNHVLAQIYENKVADGKEVKSKIKAHADKTKDMPMEGLIAFCTFYDKSTYGDLQQPEDDRYDRCHKNVSGFTRLHFRLKSGVSDAALDKEFSVTLYPNSVFMIPLSTNRLYTHEIRPSALGVDRIPTRLGYVVRCSNVEAVYLDEQTYIREKDSLVKLEPMTEQMQQELRHSYFEENMSEQFIQYGKVHFSMNAGDYEKPIY